MKRNFEDDFCYPKIDRNEDLLIPVPSNAVSFYVMMDAEGEMANRGVKIGITGGDSAGIQKRKARHEDRGSAGIVRMNFLGSCYATQTDESVLKTRWRNAAVRDKRANGKLRNIADRVEWLDTEKGCEGRELFDWIPWWRKLSFVETNLSKVGRSDMSFARPHLWMPPAHKPLERVGFLPVGAWETVVTDNDYYTPDIITHLARMTMRGIELDPASCKLANNGGVAHGNYQVGVRAKDYFDLGDDALTLSDKSWSARSAFINYPFGQMGWVNKVLSVVQKGYIGEFVLFMSAMASNNGQAGPLIEMCDLCVPNRRMNCWGPKAFSSNYYGINLLYYGPNRDRFREYFSRLGAVKS